MDLHMPVDPNKTYEELTAEEKLRYDHQKLHELHKGHESMHSTMVLILIVTLIVAQIIVVEWKKRHYRSYAFFTMVAMWSIPVLTSVKYLWWRFITIWSIFTLLTALIIRKSTYRPMSVTTPRLVYKWFYMIYKLSCFLGVVGYIVMMLMLLGLNVLFGQKPQPWMDFAIMLLFYGLYFGVLGRDVAEYCSDKMAASIGYYTQEGMPTRQLETNVCAVCGNQLLVDVNEEGVLGRTYSKDKGSCCKDVVQTEGKTVEPWPKPDPQTPAWHSECSKDPQPSNYDPYRIKVPDIVVPPLPPSNAKEIPVEDGRELFTNPEICFGNNLNPAPIQDLFHNSPLVHPDYWKYKPEKKLNNVDDIKSAIPKLGYHGKNKYKYAFHEPWKPLDRIALLEQAEKQELEEIEDAAVSDKTDKQVT